MEDIDKNGDGFIDLNEYIGEYTLCIYRFYAFTALCVFGGGEQYV